MNFAITNSSITNQYGSTEFNDIVDASILHACYKNKHQLLLYFCCEKLAYLQGKVHENKPYDESVEIPDSEDIVTPRIPTSRRLLSQQGKFLGDVVYFSLKYLYSAF